MNRQEHKQPFESSGTFPVRLTAGHPFYTGGNLGSTPRPGTPVSGADAAGTAPTPDHQPRIAPEQMTASTNISILAGFLKGPSATMDCPHERSTR